MSRVCLSCVNCCKPTLDCLLEYETRPSCAICCFGPRNGTGRNQLEIEPAVSIIVSSTLVACRGVTGR